MHTMQNVSKQRVVPLWWNNFGAKIKNSWPFMKYSSVFFAPKQTPCKFRINRTTRSRAYIEKQQLILSHRACKPLVSTLPFVFLLKKRNTLHIYFFALIENLASTASSSYSTFLNSVIVPLPLFMSTISDVNISCTSIPSCCHENALLLDIHIYGSRSGSRYVFAIVVISAIYPRRPSLLWAQLSTPSLL